ncbi:hypothetical protein KKI90_12095 [Xenorhabdus bovienii]|nr:hypothetical protein [Xenorhabdus bovienii]MDE1486622.1 hypothetical protein [Xenorhabdus bovienii]MDE9477436.1 hypothetical protein [Xenorhabdus bovienii]MDE9499152.1 hypothetical protein [Xenorhabdus bovienii]MDE9521554.1 hypothetical protein [Xenorhabdus bovienii]MDE9530826.1 hypothetical protein [Xenorhabdus bovienii]
MNEKVIIAIFIISLSVSVMARASGQKSVLPSNIHDKLNHTTNQEKHQEKITISQESKSHIQAPCRFIILEGKPESPIHDHYQLYRDNEGKIQVRIVSSIGDNIPITSKKLFTLQNKHQRCLSRFIIKIINLALYNSIMAE